MDERLRKVVGERAKRLRIQAGRSLREQARRVDLAPSALSQLENQKGGLSLERLQVLAADFGLQVTDLLTDTAESDAGFSTGHVEIMEQCLSNTAGISRGKGTIYTLLGSGHNHRLQPYMISFEPGGGYDRDLIGHEGEEFTYVLIGAIDLTLGGEVYRLRQGDAIRFDSGPVHAFRNASENAIAVVIGAATPPW